MNDGRSGYRDFNTPRRTVYLMTVRFDRSGFGPLFRQPRFDQQRRSPHHLDVAPQALFRLNNPFLLEQTRTLAKRLLASSAEDTARIQQAYPLLYGRPPSAEEIKIGQSFLTRSRAALEAEDTAGRPGLFAPGKSIARSCSAPTSLSM